MSPLASIRGTGGSINDTAVKQNQNTLTHPKDHTKGEFATLTAGTGSWTVPDGVTKICIVTVGAGGAGAAVQPYRGNGGGGGGGLSWGNNITVKPGDSLPYSVGEGGTGNYSTTGEDGGDTWIKDVDGNYLVYAEGGEGGGTSSSIGEGGDGGYTPLGTGVQGGGRGGNGSSPHDINSPSFHFSKGGGGGGAGGYENNGGYGGYTHQGGPAGTVVSPAGYGSGGGGGGGQGWGGGGVGLYGEGSSGEAGSGIPGAGEGGSPAATNTEGAKTANEPGAGPELSDEQGGGTDAGVSEGGVVGGGGASGGNFYPPDTGKGDDGNDGGLRVCWGCGVSFPDNADGHYPTPA